MEANEAKDGPPETYDEALIKLRRSLAEMLQRG
jgi:hypothetical protein